MFFATAIKVFLHKLIPLKMIAVTHFVYFYFNIIAPCICTLIEFFPYHGVCPSPPDKAIHCHTVGLYITPITIWESTGSPWAELSF